MAKTTRRTAKRKTRKPRQPREPKVNGNLPSSTSDQDLRHSVFAMLHQPGQAAGVTIREAKLALLFIKNGDELEPATPMKKTYHTRPVTPLSAPEQPTDEPTLGEYVTFGDSHPEQVTQVSYKSRFDTDKLDM